MFLCKNEAPGLERAAVVTIQQEGSSLLKRAFLYIPRMPNCMQDSKGVETFTSKMFDSFRIALNPHLKNVHRQTKRQQ